MLDFVFCLLGYVIVLIALQYIPLQFSFRKKLILVTTSFFISMLGLFFYHYQDNLFLFVLLFLLLNVVVFFVLQIFSKEKKEKQKDEIHEIPRDSNTTTNVELTNQTEEEDKENIDFIYEETDFLNKRIETQMTNSEQNEPNFKGELVEVEKDVDFEKILSQEPVEKG